MVAGGRYGTKSQNLSGDKLNLVAGAGYSSNFKSTQKSVIVPLIREQHTDKGMRKRIS